MRPFFRPLHLLLLAEAFAHHFVHRRLHKPGRNRLAVAIALSVIRVQMPVVYDVSALLRLRLDQSRILGICPLEGLDRALQIVNLAQRFVHLTMPQRPFQAFDLVPYLLTQHRLTLHETFAKLTQYRQLHREMKPVQYMRGLWAHLYLKCPQRVVAICKKRHRLVHLQALSVQHLMQASLRLGVVIRLDKPKALERGRAVLFILFKAQDTLADNDFEVMLLVQPMADIAPINAHGEETLRRRQPFPIARRSPSIQPDRSSPSSASMRFATLSVS